jgi:anti-sigma factor RsiW
MQIHPPNRRLSEYLDGVLGAAQQEEIERHLAACPACSETLAELRRVVQRAQALDDHPPRTDLWPDVAAAIGVSPGRRRVSFTVPQLAAAAVALSLLSAGAAWLALRPRVSPPVVAAAPGQEGAGGTLRAVPVESSAQKSYAAAVEELEQVLTEGRGRLDTLTTRVIEEKLVVIDRAIAEAERALATDPGNAYLHAHLAETRMHKLQLLRRAAELTRAAS